MRTRTRRVRVLTKKGCVVNFEEALNTAGITIHDITLMEATRIPDSVTVHYLTTTGHGSLILSRKQGEFVPSSLRFCDGRFESDSAWNGSWLQIDPRECSSSQAHAAFLQNARSEANSR